MHKPGDVFELGTWEANFPYPYVIYEGIWRIKENEFVLDYNYDGIVKNIKVDEDNQVFPTLERKGYLFQGWSTDGKTATYLGGDAYPDLPKGTKFIAVWEAITFRVEYYNSFTGALISVKDDATVEDKVPGSKINIAGLRFFGWVDRNPWKNQNITQWLYEEPDLQGNVYYPDESMLYLPFEDGVIKLYGYYQLMERHDDQTMVIYIPNGVSIAPPEKSFGINEEIKVSSSSMFRSGCAFDGWKILGSSDSAKKYQPGETIEGDHQYTRLIILLATWKTNYDLKLNPNHDSLASIDLSKKYCPGDYIKTEDLNPGEYKGHYLKGYSTPDGTFYFKDNDNIKVPYSDFQIKAIWDSSTYFIYYHSGFDNSVYTAEEKTSPATIRFDISNMDWNIPEGYAFVGWTENGSMGTYYDLPDSYIITPGNAKEIELTGDRHFYACYNEANNPYPDKLMVIYNAMGGTGGPGIQYYERDKNFKISDEVPEKAGSTFLGWSHLPFPADNKPDYYGGDEASPSDYSGIERLYAVWYTKQLDDWMVELQAKYGLKVFPDYYFTDEYESPYWEKANDHCYFILKTVNKSNSAHMPEMYTELIMLDYHNGQWELTGRAASNNLKEIIEFEILTHNSDMSGMGLKILNDVAFTVASEIPNLKYVMKAIDLYGLIMDVRDAMDEKGWKNKTTLVAEANLARSVWDLLYSQCGSEKEANALMSKIHPIICRCVSKGIEWNQEDIIDSITDLGLAFSAANQVDYEKLLVNVQAKFLATNTKLESTIASGLAEELKNVEGVEDIDFSDKLVKTGIDVLEIVWTISMDVVKYELSRKESDPFGDFDNALETVKKQIVELDFRQDLQDSFHDAVMNIYNAYCVAE